MIYDLFCPAKLVTPMNPKASENLSPVSLAVQAESGQSE
jgi:hypothetical protein